MYRYSILHALCLVLFVSIPSSAISGEQLRGALLTGNIEEVKQFIDNDKNLLQSKDGDGASLLHYAAMGADFHGTIEVAKLLLARGLDPNMRDKKGRTPLHYALMRNTGLEDALGKYRVGASTHLHTKMAEVLIELGAEVNAQDHNGFTALHAAATAGNEEAIKMLIERGGDANIENNEGIVPLFTAVLQKNNHIIPVLMRHTNDKYVSQIRTVKNVGVATKDRKATVEKLSKDLPLNYREKGRSIIQKALDMGLTTHIRFVNSNADRNPKTRGCTETVFWNEAAKSFYGDVARYQSNHDNGCVVELSEDGRIYVDKALKEQGYKDGFSSDVLFIIWEE